MAPARRLEVDNSPEAIEARRLVAQREREAEEQSELGGPSYELPTVQESMRVREDKASAYRVGSGVETEIIQSPAVIEEDELNTSF